MLRLWRSWLTSPVLISASSFPRPCRPSCRAVWPRHSWLVSSPAAGSLILQVGQNPPASSCGPCSACHHRSSVHRPGWSVHLWSGGHFQFLAWAQPPARCHSAPYLDIQTEAWLGNKKKSKASVKTFGSKKKKTKGENDVTKLLTLAATWSRRRVYSTKLKFNICHVTWWSRARTPLKQKTGVEMGKRSVRVCVWVFWVFYYRCGGVQVL